MALAGPMTKQKLAQLLVVALQTIAIYTLHRDRALEGDAVVNDDSAVLDLGELNALMAKPVGEQHAFLVGLLAECETPEFEEVRRKVAEALQGLAAA